MTDKQTEILRRQLLQSAAGLAVGQLVLTSSNALAATGAKPGEVSSTQTTNKPKPPGKAGDFDFLAGSWNISHRRLKTDGSKTWDEFKGEATCWSILSGIGSIEELRIPERNFSGMGLRLLDVENKIWSDFWVNARSGVLTTPGTTGYFENGVGIFIADDVDAGKPIKVRGIWDRITAKGCRWHQSISRDGGKTWDDNWLMDWSRV
jgi:hypothetical protein